MNGLGTKLFSLLVLCAGLVFLFLSCGRGRVPPRPDVILISIDTLRPDRMGVYGHRPMGVSTTPRLDDLAGGGAVFSDAVSSSSWTLPGHYALLSGLPDELHEMVDDSVRPSRDVPLMAEIFHGAGYATAGFYSGPYLHPFFGFGRGFDIYESCMDFETVFDLSPAKAEKMSHAETAEAVARTEKESHRAVTSAVVTEKAVRFVKSRVRKKDGAPFFLFLHYFDVHNDYTPPPPFDTCFGAPYDGWVDGRGVMTDPRINATMDQRDLEHLEALYDGEVGWVDRNIGRLLREIDRIDPGILKKALVVVTADHGEEFFEHGKIGHRHDLYEDAVRIPLIMRMPGRIPAGIRLSAPVRIYDILPTVLDLAGLPGPAFSFGRSLLPLIKNPERSPARPALLELTAPPRRGRPSERDRFTKIIALRSGGLKLIDTQSRTWSPGRPADFTGPLLTESWELYDLRADPGEKRNLFPERKDLFEKMRAERDRLYEKMRGIYAARRREAEDRGARAVPDELRKRLEQAGYIR